MDKNTLNADKVIEEELKYLGLNGESKKGIAFSGGGIRSASFGLGVMQGLVANEKLEEMDYMSTVSGGGFLGSALTWALHREEGNAGTKSKNFPLGEKNVGGKKEDEGKNKLLNFIRQHGNYLFPTGPLGILSFAAVVIRSILLSLFVYGSFLTILMIIFLRSNLLSSSALTEFIDLQFKGWFVPLAMISLALYLLLSFGYSVRTFFSSWGDILNKYLNFIIGQKVIGVLWKTSIVCVLIGSLPYIIDCLKNLNIVIETATGSTLFGTLVGLWQYIKAQKNDKSSSTTNDLFIYLGAFCLIYGLLLLSYLLAINYFLPHSLKSIQFSLLVGVSLLFGLIVDLNMIDPHRIWRDRLMEAYMPDKDAVKENKWKPAKKADQAFMENMCNKNNPRPYHIINTNLILVGSGKSKFRNRGGDNFIISRLFCGSDATNYKSTSTFQKKGVRRGITLPTAIATSAAALNPNAGCSGEGVTRNSIVSILLSLLNLRLGYWTTNPAKRAKYLPPNFFFPGLFSEIFRFGLSEEKTNIQLSDGGHFENLALYELIRRKLNIIVLSDGGADPHFNFDDLANVVEKVRVDFGAKITFIKGYELDNLLPDSAGDEQYIKKYGIAKKGFAIADIFYENEKKPSGRLFYIKLTMIEGLPTDVFSYKGVHSEFPHQSTADQFFDEKQFEAYRELGYHIVWKMMES
ncbi:MAG: patatin-like phospholipase family protein, partial [Cyclobacteriaceae bacterium]|nr:patatin-like phospholipase family protein [Cyclobacteriaceae bacterium]